jgi:hypothetical protein
MGVNILTVPGPLRNISIITWEQNDGCVKVMMNNAEEIRLRYLYRKLIIEGKVTLSIESAKRLIGPDCAFHLYSIIDSKSSKRKR